MSKPKLVIYLVCNTLVGTFSFCSSSLKYFKCFQKWCNYTNVTESVDKLSLTGFWYDRLLTKIMSPCVIPFYTWHPMHPPRSFCGNRKQQLSLWRLKAGRYRCQFKRWTNKMNYVYKNGKGAEREDWIHSFICYIKQSVMFWLWQRRTQRM